jgi:hypothetical protein
MYELTIDLVTPSLVFYEPQYRNDQMIAMVIISTILGSYSLAIVLVKVECIMRCELRWFSFGLVLTPASVCSGHRQSASRKQHPSQKGLDYSCFLVVLSFKSSST